jgi:SAM-dependent methyltransferase
MVFSDVSAAEYEATRHNAWDEEELDAAARRFYDDARRRPIADFLALLGTPRGRLLDVGCGLGVLLEQALEAGWDAHGCDTSGAWVREARARVGADRVVHGSVPTTGHFDVVTAWDVIEHVHDPLPFLAELGRRLAPGGRLFLRTPNLDYVLPVYAARRRLGRPGELGPLNHVVYFTARTLRKALDQCELTPRAWPALVPPQVGPARAKNAYAGAARAIARGSAGRFVLSSDLDVLATASCKTQS